MSDHAGRTRERRCTQPAPSRHRRAAAGLAVAGETALGIDGGTAFDRRAFVRRSSSRARPLAAAGAFAIRSPTQSMPLALCDVRAAATASAAPGTFKWLSVSIAWITTSVSGSFGDGATVGAERRVARLV